MCIYIYIYTYAYIFIYLHMYISYFSEYTCAFENSVFTFWHRISFFLPCASHAKNTL